KTEANAAGSKGLVTSKLPLHFQCLMNRFSTFLFAEPSFLEGMSRVLDMGGTLNSYNTSELARQADIFAMSADWHAVGQDLREAILAEYNRVLSNLQNERAQKSSEM